MSSLGEMSKKKKKKEVEDRMGNAWSSRASLGHFNHIWRAHMLQNSKKKRTILLLPDPESGVGSCCMMKWLSGRFWWAR